MVKRLSDTSDEYHSSNLIGSSAMFSGYDNRTGKINLAKLKVYLEGRKKISTQLQKAFDVGTIQHSAILEQDLSMVMVMPEFSPIPAITIKEQKEKWVKVNSELKIDVMPKFKAISGVTKKAQEERFKAENPAQYYLKQSEFDDIKGAFDVLASNDIASRMISNGLYVESSFYLESEGIKARPDIVGETDNGSLFICNYKTINDLSKCNSNIYHHCYDLRAIHEKYVLDQYFDRKVTQYFFLFQEKSAPYSMKLYQLSELDLEFGLQEYEKVKNIVTIAVKEGFYPQPTLNIEETRVYRGFHEEMGF